MCASAQYSPGECSSLFREETQALKERAFKRLISVSRQHLTYCKHLMDLDDYTSELSTLALGLSNDGQHSEALGVANWCLEISSANLECTYDKADVLLELNRPQEAKTVVERGLRYPAITAFNAEYKHMLQKMLVHINVISSDQPRQAAQRKAEEFGSAFFKWFGSHYDQFPRCERLWLVRNRERDPAEVHCLG